MDWEDDPKKDTTAEKDKEKSLSEIKSPDSRVRFLEIKSVCNDKINSNNMLDDYFSNPSPNNDSKNPSQNVLSPENRKISDDKSIIENTSNQPKSPANDRCSLEEDLMKLSETNKGVNDSFELIQNDYNSENKLLNEQEIIMKKDSTNNQSLNCSNEKIKPNDQQISKSPELQKTALNIPERKDFDKNNNYINNAKGEEESTFYNSFLCNEIEMKIIKNVLNETNQKSRFSFVKSQTEEKKGENSLKEILLSSLKINELKRTSSLNFNNEYMEKESSEKGYRFYSHLNEGDNNFCAVNLMKFYSNSSGEQKNYQGQGEFINNEDKNNNYVLHELESSKIN